MGVAIVTSELFSGPYLAHGVELGAAISNSGEDIGRAGMIHELKRAAVHAAIDGLFVAQFHNGDSLPLPGPLIRFPDGDALSGIFTNLRSRANHTVGIKTSALDTAFLNDQHLYIKVYELERFYSGMGDIGGSIPSSGLFFLYSSHRSKFRLNRGERRTVIWNLDGLSGVFLPEVAEYLVEEPAFRL